MQGTSGEPKVDKDKPYNMHSMIVVVGHLISVAPSLTHNKAGGPKLHVSGGMGKGAILTTTVPRMLSTAGAQRTGHDLGQT